MSCSRVRIFFFQLVSNFVFFILLFVALSSQQQYYMAIVANRHGFELGLTLLFFSFADPREYRGISYNTAKAPPPER